MRAAAAHNERQLLGRHWTVGFNLVVHRRSSLSYNSKYVSAAHYLANSIWTPTPSGNLFSDIQIIN